MDNTLTLEEAEGLEAVIINIVDSTTLDKNSDLVLVRQFTLEIEREDGTKQRTYMLKRSTVMMYQEDCIKQSHLDFWTLMVGDRVKIVETVLGYSLKFLQNKDNSHSIKSFHQGK